MYRGKAHFPGKPLLPLADQARYFMHNAPMPSVFNGAFMSPGIRALVPFHGAGIQPSDACPRNFVVFGQTTDRSQIMFHPEISTEFFYPGFGADVHGVDQKDANDKIIIPSTLEEDADDIDALLSTEEDESVEYDDDEISTARSHAYHECNSPHSCSSYKSLPRKSGSSSWKSSKSCYSDRKHKRIRKMMKTLRGIVPGGNRMSTVAVIDETVPYLKSLQVEVQKPGARNSKGYT